MAQVHPDNYRALGMQSEAGSSNGLFVEVATGQVVTMKDSVVVGYADPSLHCRVTEDFLGKALNVTDSIWGVKDTSSAGTPTAAILADADCGQFEFKFSSNDEAQVLTLYWNDELNIDPAQGPVMTCRLKTVAQLLSTDTLVLGLASAQNDAADSVASHAWFRIQGANDNLLVESDNGSVDNDDDDTGVDVTADTFAEFKVDASNYLDVKFYYRATLGGEWTDVTPSSATYKLHATTGLQPFVQIQKSGGAGETDFLIDYVDVAWKRN